MFPFNYGRSCRLPAGQRPRQRPSQFLSGAVDSRDAAAAVTAAGRTGRSAEPHPTRRRRAGTMPCNKNCHRRVGGGELDRMVADTTMRRRPGGERDGAPAP